MTVRYSCNHSVLTLTPPVNRGLGTPRLRRSTRRLRASLARSLTQSGQNPRRDGSLATVKGCGQDAHCFKNGMGRMDTTIRAEMQRS